MAVSCITERLSHSQASKRAHDVRVTVLQALADIPYWVGRANRYRDLYEESKPRDLVQKTAQLCSAVLVALRHIMVYFTEGILSTPFIHPQLIFNGIH